MEETNPKKIRYRDLLKQYIHSQDEAALYGAEQISKEFIQSNISPEEIVDLHIQVMTELYPSLSAEVRHSLDFLLEMMIAYGVAQKEFNSLMEEQSELKSEIAIAANMQETLLTTEKPDIQGMDIGVVSVPANQMSGDYYHFLNGGNGSLGITIADIIGKGVPAALSMSMIKYSMESLPEEHMNPRDILKNLNRVVVRNVDSSMFISMIYAQVFPDEGKMYYASAGHEPGFYYHAETQTFEEIDTKGLVLGVLPDVNYEQYERTINDGDMVILLTDGVTECRYGDRFIETEEVLEVIRQYIELPAQEIADKVYKYFERLQDFQLRDDFTLMILRKCV